MEVKRISRRQEERKKNREKGEYVRKDRNVEAMQCCGPGSPEPPLDRIRIIYVFEHPDPLVTSTDPAMAPDPNPSIIKLKWQEKP